MSYLIFPYILCLICEGLIISKVGISQIKIQQRTSSKLFRLVVSHRWYLSTILQFREMIGVILTFELLLIVLVISKAEEKIFCEQNNGDNHVCISIRECPHLYGLMWKNPLTQHDIQFLRKSHCGFIGNVPKVCCKIDDEEAVKPINGNLLPDKDTCGFHVAKNIHGGTRVKLDEFPWLALLITETPQKQKRHRCGGMLISKRYVLTAAHCVRDESNPEAWKLTAVRLGEYNKDSPVDCIDNGFKRECLKIKPVTVPIEKIIRHQGYNSITYHNDIALLRLSRDVSFNLYVKPICLPLTDSEKRKPNVGEKLITAGWGQTTLKAWSHIKLKVRVPVVLNQHCSSIYLAKNKSITDKQICAGGREGRGTCLGDSGGPLMSLITDDDGFSNWYAIGVVSFGVEPCGTPGWPSVYTKVSKYIGWILRNLEP